MDNRGFRIPIDLAKYTDDIITYVHSQKSQYAADRLLKKHFETVFGMCDHRANGPNAARPLFGMALTEGNSIGGYHDIDYLLDKYEDLGIYEITKMTYEDFANLTPSRMAQVEATCRRIKERKGREIDLHNRAMEQQMRQFMNGGEQKK